MKIILFVILLFTSSLFASLHKVSVQLEWKHQFQFAGFYVAKEKGYYKNAGLEVDIKEFSDNINIIDDILNNKSTFGVSSSSILLNKLQNKPLVLLASYLKQNGLVLATKPNIHKISDLKHKKIMINSKQIESTSIGAMLQNNNLSKTDYIHIKHDYKIDKFVSGEVDAISIFISNQPYLLDKLNIKYNILNPSADGIYSFDIELFTSKQTALNSTNMVDAFIKATNKGWEYALNHKKETVKLIYNKYSKIKSKNALLYEAEKIEKLFNTNIFKIGSIVPALVKINAQMYINLGLIDKNINITNSLSDYFLKNIKDEKEKQIQEDIHFFNNKASLSDLQKDYLKQKEKITACINPKWMPFESYINNTHIGLTSDYFKIITDEIKIPIKIIPTKTWTQSLEFAKNRKCDIISLLTKSNDKQEYLNFTSPYLEVPLIIVTKHNVKFITNLREIKDKTIGISKSFAFSKVIQKKYSNLLVVNVENTKEGLQKVSNGEIFAYIGTLANVSYIFQKEFIGELKISGKFDESLELRMGIRNDDFILLEILEKILHNISYIDKQIILNKWTVIKHEKDINYTPVWQILIILMLITIGTIYWNRRLSLLNIELENAKIKAEEATLTKSNFLANISHEIRTPMNSIVNMAYLAKEKTVDSTQLHRIEAIEKASNNLLTMLNNILDLSKVEANKLEINKIKFDLTQVLDNVNKIMKPKAFEKGLIFDIIYNKPILIHLYGDDFKLTQILINLVSNAIKFTDNGHIKIFISQIQNNKFKFSVCDTGIGIIKEQIDKLFLPFTQADSSITRKYGGTGLGLSITKELVELMNGKIWIISTINKGSEFIFEVELEKSSAVSKEKVDTGLSIYKKIKLHKKRLKDEKRDELFAKLEAAVISRRPYLCKPIITKIEEYQLSDEYKKLFIEVKSLLNKYKFNEARELLDGK